MVKRWEILQGDVRETLRALETGSVQTCVTSPPYFGLRDYGVSGQIGLEPTPAEYVEQMVAVFREVRRVLRDDGTLWLNLGDSYASGGGTGSQGSRGERFDRRHTRETLMPVRKWPHEAIKPKDLIGIPWRVAFALQQDGWYLRQDIIWHKSNPMPESVRDRCTKAHEYVFLLSKSERYYWDAEAMQEPANLTGKGNANGFRGGAYINNSTFDNAAGGNRTQKGNVGTRSKRDSFKRDGSKRAEVIPGQSVGTHRPDRPESEYDVFTRNRRSVWTVATRPYKGAHFATFPPALIEPCILAGAPFNGLVLDPFTGSGTTAAVALQHGRRFIGCELNPDYIKLAEARIAAAEAEVLW
ncbi:MAG: site-specific DNA-methyltransferase [Kiritimatiellae bacterium]|nr:site-specific DNA-methyltransferase [Kiritimatiellia bacterium]